MAEELRKWSPTVKLILEGNNLTTVQTTALKSRRKLASGKKKKGIQGLPKWDWGDTSVLASLFSKGILWLLGSFKKLQTDESVVGLHILQTNPYHEMMGVKMNGQVKSMVIFFMEMKIFMFLFINSMNTIWQPTKNYLGKILRVNKWFKECSVYRKKEISYL